MKFGASFALFATISMMFAVVYAEDVAPAVVSTTEAIVEAPVTGAVGGGAESTKEPASGEVTGAAGGASVPLVSTVVPPIISSGAPASPPVETTTKGTQSFASSLFALGVLLVVATL